MTPEPIPPYRDLLETAWGLGHADGRWAARAQLAEPPGVPPVVCRGRGPEEFARLLWGPRPGAPPSGLECNAPLWYADGFTAALAEEQRRPEPATVGSTGGPLPGPAVGR